MSIFGVERIEEEEEEELREAAGFENTMVFDFLL
jgi:hypothetical protein